MRPARLGGGGGWERAADAVPARLSAHETRGAEDKSLHFALRSIFWRSPGRRRGARAASARAPGDGSYFFALGCFKLNRPSFVSRRALNKNAPCRPTRARRLPLRRDRSPGAFAADGAALPCLCPHSAVEPEPHPDLLCQYCTARHSTMDVTRSVASPSDDIKKAAVFEKDALLSAQTMIYDDGEMKKTLPGDVYERFKQALVDGGATSDEDQEAISKALYAWARERGATDYAHWFFPMRGGSGATGGMRVAPRPNVEIASMAYTTNAQARRVEMRRLHRPRLVVGRGEQAL